VLFLILQVLAPWAGNFWRERNDATLRRKVTKFIQDIITILVECRGLLGEIALTAVASRRKLLQSRGSSVVEQPIRNRQVASSTLALGSIIFLNL
jgi:hypothetical protein